MTGRGGYSGPVLLALGVLVYQHGNGFELLSGFFLPVFVPLPVFSAWMHGDIHHFYSTNPCLPGACAICFFCYLFYFYFQRNQPSTAAAFGTCLAGLRDLAVKETHLSFIYF